MNASEDQELFQIFTRVHKDPPLDQEIRELLSMVTRHYPDECGGDLVRFLVRF